MKQTNNAIKFLLAQYRAVFKSAYLKGLVSAVVLTTGLAAGAANAEGDADTFADLATTEDITISGSLTASGAGGYTGSWNANATVSGNTDIAIVNNTAS